MILDASLTDATGVVLSRLCARLESWQCPIPTLFIFFAAFSSRSCSVPGVSSRRYGQAGYKKPHEEALWSPSYFAISVGEATLEVLKQYIRNQEKPLL